ncbi:MAG: RidA family protein [Dysgonamonadaceae bacterium]|jgi:2-iminobutanoate/2-iminopropanoate deaminase|nr:RidA family protein [Dysgonamonadaceae bacterium]
MKQVISTTNAPAAIGPYSQAIRTGNFVFLSGQLGLDPKTGEFVSNSVVEQAEQVFKNIKSVLNEAGLDFKDVVKTTVFLSDMGNFAKVNEIYARYFEEPYPARSAFAIMNLPKNALVEIEVIAAVS